MTVRRRLHGAASDEAGSTLPLVLVYAVLALALVYVAVSSTSLYLERKRLFTLADGAALAAAEAWSVESVHVDAAGFGYDLGGGSVEQAASDYLADAASADVEAGEPPEFDGLELVRATTDDAMTATITLRAVWHAPLSNDLVPIEIPVEVTSTARSVFH